MEKIIPQLVNKAKHFVGNTNETLDLVIHSIWRQLAVSHSTVQMIYYHLKYLLEYTPTIKDLETLHFQRCLIIFWIFSYF